MNKNLISIFTLFLVACSSPKTSSVLSVEGGLIEGVAGETGSVTVYKGIPYADRR